MRRKSSRKRLKFKILLKGKHNFENIAIGKFPNWLTFRLRQTHPYIE